MLREPTPPSLTPWYDTPRHAAQVRVSGLGLAYNISMAIFGGTTPVICTALTLAMPPPNNALLPGLWVIFVGLLSSICLVLAPTHIRTYAASSGLASKADDDGGGLEERGCINMARRDGRSTKEEQDESEAKS